MYTTELDAVNRMLLTIGEVPLSTLENLQHADAIMARQTLEAVSRDVQSEGWYFNVEKECDLALDTDGYIPVPYNAISVDIEPISNRNAMRVTVRERRLYDMTNHTYVFNGPLKATIMFYLPFESLPEVAKSYIAIRAARKFQAESVGSETLHGFTKQDEYLARSTLMREQIKNTDCNFLSYRDKSYFGINTINRITDRRI